jgi:hypothetical protein
VICKLTYCTGNGLILSGDTNVAKAGLNWLKYVGTHPTVDGYIVCETAGIKSTPQDLGGVNTTVTVSPTFRSIAFVPPIDTVIVLGSLLP